VIPAEQGETGSQPPSPLLESEIMGSQSPPFIQLPADSVIRVDDLLEEYVDDDGDVFDSPDLEETSDKVPLPQ